MGFSGWGFRDWVFGGWIALGAPNLHCVALFSWEVWLLAVTCGVVCSDFEEALGALRCAVQLGGLVCWLFELCGGFVWAGTMGVFGMGWMALGAPNLHCVALLCGFP